ncbi:TonB-dependent receptor [Pseudoxanthomonas suwonensis 11-1]|uniref:TonB-dependent receptor n=1 Tax=Pseudoxanthomonas suwonensis (strain 11-1) TaxID=743721 RepID=E6WRU2_PSEUU|nr:TonB-dependent receptor [Pseudoxanthomonas suwonensis]ADV26891.1 TonB-dependent receptor [Pseudoxanthomonas suwonensis 11-1]
MSNHTNRAGSGAKSRMYPQHCALAMGVALVLAGTAAQAQEANTNSSSSEQAVELETVQVTGLRGSLMRAQDLKQEAEQIIDSVTAQDIGAMPDRSVTETLKRVSGVTVTGFAARDDTDHFSAEGSGVMIRGLTFVRGELNGRDVFSANGGRGLSFEEVPSELMAGVDVYKNPSAEIIEGGLGGTVNLRTRKPFDEPGRKIAGSLDYNYGDKAKDARPSASFLFSDRWDTGVGEMGFLANLSYSELATRSDGIQIQPYSRRGRTPAEQPEGLPNGEGWVYDWEQEAWVSSDSQRDLLLEGTDFDHVFIPGGVNWRRTDFDRTRQGGALAFQWRPNEDTEITTQVITSKYDITWREHFMEYAGAGEANNTDNWTGDPNYYGNSYDGGDGLADRTNRLIPMPGTNFLYDQYGRFLKGSIRLGGWRGQPGDDSNGMYQGPGIQFAVGNRVNVSSSQTTDWSTSLRHYLTDKLIMRADLQYVKAESEQVDFSVHTSTLLEGITLDLTGKYPSVTLDDPNYALQQENYFWRSAMDHLADNEGTERAARLDFEYSFDSDWWRMARFGVRFSDREYSSFYTTYNWGVISDDWNRIENPDPSRPPVAWADQFYSGQSKLYTLKDFFRGKANVPTQFWAAADSFVNIDKVNNTLAQIPGAQWQPIGFSPDAVNTQDETTQAAYGVLYFENNDAFGGRPVDGNFGVRVVKTKVEAVGGGLMPDMTTAYLEDVAPEVRDAFYGQYFEDKSSSSYTDVLPSLNVRVRFDHGLQWRFAASKAIARPEFRLMQNWITLGANAAGCAQAREDGLRTELCSFDDLAYSGSGGNPDLKPMRANQFDTALEWYFGPGNSAYITLFAKDVKDYFATAIANEVIDGRNYVMSRTRNLDEGKIRGFELGYSQFFDFLPGLGLQANYTFVDSSGGTNADVSIPDGTPAEVPVDLPLEGLSRRSYNVMGIYERGLVSMRLAYNWRSRYLLTSSDVMPAMRQPVWNDDYGQLDGSIFFNINSNIQLGLQANNLTNSTTKLLMGPRGYRRDGFIDETLYNRAWFENDRRYSLVLRASW